jgi:hypothetical protein
MERDKKITEDKLQIVLMVSSAARKKETSKIS